MAIIGLRYYSHKPVVALSLEGGASTDRGAGQPIEMMGTDLDAKFVVKGIDRRHRLERGRTDRHRRRQPGRTRTTTTSTPQPGFPPRTSATATIVTVAGSARPQRRPFTSSRTPAETAESSSPTRARRAVELPRHTMWASPVDPTNAGAGLCSSAPTTAGSTTFR